MDRDKLVEIIKSNNLNNVDIDTLIYCFKQYIYASNKLSTKWSDEYLYSFLNIVFCRNNLFLNVAVKINEMDDVDKNRVNSIMTNMLSVESFNNLSTFIKQNSFSSIKYFFNSYFKYHIDYKDIEVLFENYKFEIENNYQHNKQIFGSYYIYLLKEIKQRNNNIDYQNIVGYLAQKFNNYIIKSIKFNWDINKLISKIDLDDFLNINPQEMSSNFIAMDVSFVKSLIIFFKYDLSSTKTLQLNKNSWEFNPSNLIGFKLGDDLNSILKYQFVWQKHSHLTKQLFNLKYIEKKLIQLDNRENTYDLQNLSSMSLGNELHPFIICIDVSMSMRDNKIIDLVNTITYHLCKEAFKTNTPVYLINFSDQFDFVEIKGRKDNQKVVKFLSSSYAGGTDIDKALQAIIKCYKENKQYSRSKLLFISDFFIDKPNYLLKKKIIELKKEKELTFIAIRTISGFFNSWGGANIPDFFDHKFFFNFSPWANQRIEKQIKSILSKAKY